MSRLFASTSTVKSHRGKRRLGDRVARAVALFVALLMVTIGIPTVLTQASASAATRVTPAANPDLAASCGLDVVLVLDASGSIDSANAENDVKSAANTFLDAFKDTNTRIGIVKFNTKAITPALGLTTVTTASTGAGGAHRSAVDSYNATGRTNWEDALLSAKNVFTSASPARTVPKLVVFVTDGAPNTTNDGSGTDNHTDASADAVDPAVVQMNAIKALGAHSLVVAAGQAFSDTSPANARIDALYRVSQHPTPKIYPTTAFDAATTDLILQKDFSALGDTLREVANKICDGILTVTKYASSADAPNDYVKQGSGWDFTTTVSPSGDWLKPTTGSGASKTAATDSNGMTLFQWNNSSPTWTKTATVTDTGKANYTPDHVECSTNGGSYSNVALSGSNFDVNVGAGKQVACKVYNKFTGPPNTDVGITKTVSSAQVTVGETVTWTLKAQNYGPNTATNVKFTDVVPAGLGAVSGVNAPAGTSFSGGVWTINSLAVGAGNTKTLTFTTTVDTTGDHLNKVSLTSLNEKDTNAANDKSEANVKGVKSDLSVTKSVNLNPQVVGGNVEWTVTVTNNGPAEAKNVQAVDTLGADLTYVSSDNGGVYAAGPRTVTWNVGTLASGASKTLKVVTQGTAPGTKTNSVVVSTTTPESNSNNNTASATTKFTISDLAVTKTVNKHDVTLGETVEWTVTITNNGDATAKDVTVVDAVPAGLELLGTTPAGALVGNTWTVGDLAPGATKVLKLTTKVNSLDPVTNRACGYTTTPQSSTANDCASDTVSATAADVTVTKVPSLSEVYINGSVTWTITVANQGKADATNVVVTDLGPVGLTLSGSGTASQGTYAGNANGGTWNVGLVKGTVNQPPNGGSATLTLSSTVGSTLGTLTNKVKVTTDTPETDKTNNEGQGTVNVTAADVTITKVADDHDVYLGESVVWTIKATNNGPATALDVVVTDVIPAGLQVTGVVPAGALVGSTWNVGTLAGNGGSKTLVITTKTTAVGSITNSVVVVTSTPETDTGNNSAQDTIKVTSAELTVTKTADTETQVLGGQVVWTVKVTNNGTADAQDVVLTDVVPDGLEVISTVPAGVLVDGKWNVGTLAKNGGSATLTITTKATQTGSITNCACVKTSTPEGNKDDNCDEDTVTVTAPKVSITKVADKEHAILGDTVVWTIKATNSGNADAQDVTVTDTVPAGLTVTNSSATKGSFAGGVWTIGTLAKQSTETLTLTSTVTKVGSITNSACIDTTSAEEPDTFGVQGGQTPPAGGKTCDDDTVKVHAPDVKITKTADDKTPGYQGTVVWTITATNTGDAAAQNVVANDSIPAGLTVDSANVPAGTQFSAATGVWTIGTLDAGATKVLTLTTTVTQLGDIKNSVCITTTTPMVEQGARCDDDTVTVTAPNLTITKVAGTESALLGDTVHWIVTVTNTGDRDAQNVVVTDTAGAGVDITAANPTQGSYDLGTDVWSVGTLAKNGGTASIDLTSKVTKTGDLPNEACVTTPTRQVDNAKRCDDDTVKVTAADVTITKVSDQPAYVLGDQVVWTVVATNNGTADAQNVVVNDTVPANLTVNSANADQGSYDTATNVWTVGTLLAAGDSATLTLTTTPNTTGSFVNHVHVSTTTPETNYDNNDCEATVVVKAPKLVIEKTADLQQQYLGGNVVWTVKVTNTGNAPALGVVVTDVVPSTLQVLSTDPANALTDNTWEIGTLPAGESATLTITTKTLATGDLTNEACVDTTSPMTDDGEICDDDAVTVTRDVKLSITKTQSASTPNPIQVGANVSYDITVTNSGKSPADEVHFTDTLPNGLEYVSATGTDWTCVNVAQDVDCTYDVDLAAGATTPAVVVTAKVLPVLLQADPVTNLACITPVEGNGGEQVREAAVVDQNEGQCDEATTEFPKGDLLVEKTNSPDSGTTLGWGDTITYKLKVTASGQLDQTNVVVTDDIPGYGSNSSSTPTTYVAGSAACVEPSVATLANCGIVPTTTDGKVTKLTWNLGNLAHGQVREVTFKVTIDVAPSNPEGNGDSVTVLNAGKVKSTEIPEKPSNEVENPVQVVTAIGDTDSSCVSDTPYFSFESDGWFANEIVTLHILDKDGNEVETRQVTSDANGNIQGTELWPGFSQDPVTGVKTYPGLDVRPMQFFLTGSPQTPTVTVEYPPASAKCDAGIEITKSNEPTGMVEVGDTITYRITVKIPSNASYNQDGVVVSDYIPGYDPSVESGTTTYVADSAKCEGEILPGGVGKCDVSLTKNGAGKVTQVTWALGSMKPGQSLDMVFQVTADAQPDADTDTVKLYNAAVVQSDYWPATKSNQVENTLDLVGVEGTKTPGGVLAATGSDVFRMLSIALSLLVVGGFLLRSTRRREELGGR